METGVYAVVGRNGRESKRAEWEGKQIGREERMETGLRKRGWRRKRKDIEVM